MALITPDFGEITNITAGTYKVRVVDSEEKTSQAGNTYLRWTLEVFGADKPANNGARLYLSTPISGKGAFRLAELLKATTGELPTSFDPQNLHGRECTALVVDGKTASGEPSGYMEVKAVSPLR